MIIAIDYDGTIADTNREKAKWIKTQLALEIAPWDCNRSDCVPLIGAEAYDEMSNWVYERESTLQAGEVPGALKALEELGQRADVYVITARPSRRVAFAREWLQNYGALQHIKDVRSIEGSSKAQICESIGAHVLIDDDLRHLQGAGCEGLRRVLLQHGRPEQPLCESGVSFCRTWAETIALVDSLAQGVGQDSPL